VLVQDKPIALVTSAYHMPRAMRPAARYGLNAMAFPGRLGVILGDPARLSKLAADR
jgi:uncharacterized SAM-binding protein YcdF (DUF218 family)